MSGRLSKLNYHNMEELIPPCFLKKKKNPLNYHGITFSVSLSFLHNIIFRVVVQIPGYWGCDFDTLAWIKEA